MRRVNIASFGSTVEANAFMSNLHPDDIVDVLHINSPNIKEVRVVYHKELIVTNLTGRRIPKIGDRVVVYGNGGKEDGIIFRTNVSNDTGEGNITVYLSNAHKYFLSYDAAEMIQFLVHSDPADNEWEFFYNE